MITKNDMNKFDYAILWFIDSFGRFLTWIYTKIVEPIEDYYAKKYGGEFVLNRGNDIVIIE